MKCTQKQWAHTNHWGSYKLTLRHVRKNNGLIQIIGLIQINTPTWMLKLKTMGSYKSLGLIQIYTFMDTHIATFDITHGYNCEKQLFFSDTYPILHVYGYSYCNVWHNRVSDMQAKKRGTRTILFFVRTGTSTVLALHCTGMVEKRTKYSNI